MFETLDLLKKVVAVGGPQTQGVIGRSQFDDIIEDTEFKGQPPQLTSYSVRAAAAVIPDQSLIDISRKA